MSAVLEIKSLHCGAELMVVFVFKVNCFERFISRMWSMSIALIWQVVIMN